MVIGEISLSSFQTVLEYLVQQDMDDGLGRFKTMLEQLTQEIVCDLGNFMKI